MSTAPSLSATQTPERSTPSADAVRAARAQENDTAVHVKDDMESSLLGDYKVTYENPSGSGRCIATAVALRKRLGLTGLIAVLLTVSVMVLIVIVLVESSRHVPAVVAPIRTREVCNVSSLWNTSRHPSCNGGPSLPVGPARAVSPVPTVRGARLTPARRLHAHRLELNQLLALQALLRGCGTGRRLRLFTQEQQGAWGALRRMREDHKVYRLLPELAVVSRQPMLVRRRPPHRTSRQGRHLCLCGGGGLQRGALLTCLRCCMGPAVRVATAP